MANNNSGDMIHVSSYTRDDGTQVDDYYRARPDGGSISENSGSSSKNSFGNNETFSQECPALTKLFGSANMNDAPVPVPDPVVILKGGVTFIRIVMEGAIKVAKVVIETIGVALPVVAALYGAYKTGKAVYDKVSDVFSSKESQTQIKTLNTAIQGLRETQGLQKRNIDLLSKKAANAKNQEEYSKLHEELAKLKAQHDKNNILLDKIEYSTQQQDYKSVMDGFQSYMDNANQIIDDSSTTLKGSVEKSEIPEFDSSYFEQGLSYDFEDSHKSFDEAHKETYLTDELMNNLLGVQPASAEEYVPKVQENYDKVMPNQTPYTDNSEISPLKGGVSKNIEKMGELIKPIVRKAVNGPVLSMLDTKMGKIALDLINQILNQKAKDAADLMQISLYGPENLEPTSDYTPTNKDFNKKLSVSLGINNTSIEIPKDWNGVVFENDSHLAQSLSNSKQLKDIVQNEMKKLNPNVNRFSISLDSTKDQNLFKSIHGGTIINPKMNNGYFTGILYDKYDFDLLLDEYMDKNKIKNTVINNLAYYLQGTNILNNYYLIVPIKIKF